MEIRDSVFARLREIKGDRSYSDVIESLLNENIITPAETAKFETGAASYPVLEVPA